MKNFSPIGPKMAIDKNVCPIMGVCDIFWP